MKSLIFCLCLGLAAPCLAADDSWMNASKNEPVPDSSWMGGEIEKDLKTPFAGLPIGSIVVWTKTGKPERGVWVECNGASVSASDYPEYTGRYGTKVPDLRGKFVRGHGGKSGALGETQKAQLGEHHHKVGGSSSWLGYYSDGWGAYESMASEGGHHASTETITATGAKDFWPENVAVKYLIRIK